MKQMTFFGVEYTDKRKQARKELFLIEMDQVVPWKGLSAKDFDPRVGTHHELAPERNRECSIRSCLDHLKMGFMERLRIAAFKIGMG